MALALRLLSSRYSPDQKRQLADLNQVREHLDNLCYHEPTRHQEVTTKLNIVNGMLRDKLAKARHLISSIEFGCDVCHPDQGMAYEYYGNTGCGVFKQGVQN